MSLVPLRAPEYRINVQGMQIFWSLTAIASLFDIVLILTRG
jgi:hypothetical protein